MQTPLARLHIRFLFGSQCLPSREKYNMSELETTAPLASENSLRHLLLDMKSDLMQHVHDCVSNAMQDFARDDVSSESCDDHSNPLVSDEIVHFLAHNVGQHSGETQAEPSGDLKKLGTFRSDYDYEYEYEFFNVYPVRMPDCVRLSRQLVLSSKSRRHLDANYEIFNKSRPPTTSSR